MPKTGANNTSRQHDNTMQQRKDSVHGYPDQSERQQKYPEKRIENERSNRHTSPIPAEHDDPKLKYSQRHP